MISNRTILAGVAGAVTAVALTGCGGPTPVPTAAGAPQATTKAAAPAAPAAPPEQRVELRVTGGEVEGGLARVEVERGAPVVIVVTSDRPDEAHLHGYDRAVELQAGRPAELRFTADVPGSFEFELHESGAQLARVEVR
ncbi:hypothetical protein AD006_30850 (plasmid) [Pseudonocardia sp. EC080610-09]|uniref:hypothetical protein n=1 Tax=unclassified Pseudonocardia TaxID=2619320 RepID=UPI00070624FF|nr:MULTISPECIES: hypothetical protein [unclassified Pseudonocardia]ALL79602.1 hypothetical protein AD006_30850 [Pseudonocardia sp. EC080610-09]ALL85443.1 hypothetical protein AD017_30385 [Pseudonocardia sp. EC080619-01]